MYHYEIQSLPFYYCFQKNIYFTLQVAIKVASSDAKVKILLHGISPEPATLCCSQ